MGQVSGMEIPRVEKTSKHYPKFPYLKPTAHSAIVFLCSVPVRVKRAICYKLTFSRIFCNIS